MNGRLACHIALSNRIFYKRTKLAIVALLSTSYSHNLQLSSSFISCDLNKCKIEMAVGLRGLCFKVADLIVHF